MTSEFFLTLILYLVVLTLLAVPLGRYIALVFQERKSTLFFLPDKIANIILRIIGRDSQLEMDWMAYSIRFMLFNIISIIFVYLIQVFQAILPLNPNGVANIAPIQALNIAVSFATNTNWQVYSGEAQMSYLTIQSLALCSQNFLSAASGLAVLLVVFRAFYRKEERVLGNFWRDIVRATTHILMPISIILALVLVAEGVPQAFNSTVEVKTLDRYSEGENIQKIALGPVASQVAIKQLGTNGGGYFNANSAHPFENPTPLTNFLECLSILLIPAALCFSFGFCIGKLREGLMLYSAMCLIFIVCVVASGLFEILNFSDSSSKILPKQEQISQIDFGNMEGKELRIGIPSSVIWGAATTAASNESVNSMHDSYMPLAALPQLLLMQMGEVVFGGVGSGLYGMLAFAIITVFISGLLVGRTPEYLGKKIEAFEIKMVSIVVLVPCILSLVGTSIALILDAEGKFTLNHGPHGFTEILYAYSSMGNNNGSAFGGFSAALDVHCILGSISMFISRYLVAVPIIALAGSLVKKKIITPGPGTLPTDTPLFVCLLVAVVFLLGALTFFPALALGPVVEHLQLMGG